MEDTLKKIKRVERQFQGRDNRMDTDASLTNLDKYILKTWDNKDIPGAVSVTMNDPAVYLNSILSWIMSAKWQTIVEGDITPTQERAIEKFLEASFDDVDERLTRQKKQKLFPFIATHICARGWIGARWLWVNDPKFYLDCLPIDARYCTYEVNDEGFIWFNNKTFRSAESIEAEYGKKIHTQEVDIEVNDCWDSEKNEVWINNELVKQVPNPYRYPPFVLVPAPEGFLLLDKGYMVHEGESIFFLDRDMYKYWNQLVSIDQTLALGSISPVYQMQVDEQTGEVVPLPPLTSAVAEVKKGSPYELIQKPDINKAVNVAHEHISRAITRGGISDIDIAVPPRVTSALWITEQEELRGKVIVPRLQAIESFYQQSARMIIDQYQKGMFEGELGRKGKKKLISFRELGDPEKYDIRYKLMSKSKRQEIANITIASAAKGNLSRDTILRDILIADDPEGEIAKIETEEAEKMIPSLALMRKAYSAALEAQSLHGMEAELKKMQSIMLTRQMVMAIQSPQAVTPQKEKRIPPRELVPLLTERGAIGRTIPVEGEAE